MLRYAIGAAAFALAVGSIDPAAAQRVKAGVLTCDVSAGIGFIIGSQKTVSCVFAPEPAGPQQVYSGSISKFGLDIGVTSSGVMIWGVFTDSMGPNPGFLAGDYFGATGEVTIAAGLGANVLVGGSNRTVALQRSRWTARSDSISPWGSLNCICAPVPDRRTIARCVNGRSRGRPFFVGMQSMHIRRFRRRMTETPPPLAKSPSGLKR